MKLYTSYKIISIGVSAFQAQGKFKIHSKFKNVINLINQNNDLISLVSKKVGNDPNNIVIGTIFAVILYVSIQNTSTLRKQNSEDLPRGRPPHTIFKQHFAVFCSRYEEEYAGTYGKFRLERIQLFHCMNNGGRVAMLGIPAEESQVNWNDIIFKGLLLKGIYGREMFETWYKMAAMIRSGQAIPGYASLPSLRDRLRRPASP